MYIYKLSSRICARLAVGGMKVTSWRHSGGGRGGGEWKGTGERRVEGGGEEGRGGE